MKRISVRAVIIKNSQILLIHRKKEGKEYWVFPGGGIEEGETTSQAVVREVWEETSLKVTKLGEPIPYINSTFDQQEYYFVCEVGEEEPKLDPSGTEKITADNWYNPEWVSLEKFKILENIYPEEIRSFHLSGGSVYCDYGRERRAISDR